MPDDPAPRVHLDAAAGLPLHPAAREALGAALDDGWADPSRLYREARRAAMLLDAARESIAAALGARADEVSFAASGTQAAHLGVIGLALGRARVGRRLVVSAVEHSSVLRAADRAAVDGAVPQAVPVGRDGRVDAQAFARACLGPQPAAVACLQAANGEIGTRQPVGEVADLLSGSGVPLLVDAAAAVGWVPVPPGWSVLTASAHKWGGPAGIGVLAVRTGTRWRTPLPVDERESGRVPGFPAVPLAVAAAAGLEAVARTRGTEAARLHDLVDRIRTEVVRTVPEVEVHGDPVHRLPHVVGMSFLYADGEALVSDLDRAGLAVGSGSACASDTRRPSHVLVAVGALTHGNVRVSLPHGCPGEHVDRLLGVLPATVAAVRARLGAPI